ncbi:hypothetical protein WIV_gp049 [Wiseana iridescent virus]|uniref:Nonstructural protein WIV domain-containing protein n=1 Tax=Wiseana iridescent virus TaxID=68347 RepID=G0T575_IRV9|nr:hypothetical protein WIV_gp049 [Wiseana iridescent virus]ADO00392.1 hypothetical protein [Wiseana iridescent virus]
MGQEIENFVTYSLRYQLLLAQHVASICNCIIYIFDKNGFFDNPEDTKVEVIDGVRTVSKEGLRAVLSVAVKESFGSNEDLFLKFIDHGVTQKNDIGLYVVAPQKKSREVGEDDQQQVNLTEVGEEDDQQQVNLTEVGEEDDQQQVNLTEVRDAVEKLESTLI